MMEIKTKHEKYKDFATRKQLVAQGLIPTSEGVDLWTNQYMSKVAIYYDTKKAVKLDTVYIWKNYYYKDDLTVVEIAAVDQLGNTLFAKPVKPDKRWLADHADGWINEEHRHFTGYDVLFASPSNVVQRQLVSVLKKLKYLKNIISYNVDFNIPTELVKENTYKKIDLMKLFAEVVKEPLEHSDYYEYEDNQKYKWQTLDKYLSYYHVKPSSDKAVDIANALRKCYKKMND